MLANFEDVPESDPLAVPQQRAIIDEVIGENVGVDGAPMIVLNELQSRIGYISEPMQRYIAERLGVTVGQIHGVVTFYSSFTTEPRGKHTVRFCMGTACYVGGAPQLIDKAKQILGIDVGDTTDDWQLTIDICRCVGACSQAPVVMIDDDVYGRMTPSKLPKVIAQYQ
jgi:NADH:ubiquinone oxidoreductase subunit E